MVEECKNHGVRAISIAADIKDLEEMKRAVETCVQELGSLSILVNNGYPPPPLSSFSLFPPFAHYFIIIFILFSRILKIIITKRTSGDIHELQ